MYDLSGCNWHAGMDIILIVTLVIVADCYTVLHVILIIVIDPNHTW